MGCSRKNGWRRGEVLKEGLLQATQRSEGEARGGVRAGATTASEADVCAQRASGRRGVREINLGFPEWAMEGRGPMKDVCDWRILPQPGNSNGSLGTSLRRVKKHRMN